MTVSKSSPRSIESFAVQQFTQRPKRLLTKTAFSYPSRKGSLFVIIGTRSRSKYISDLSFQLSCKSFLLKIIGGNRRIQILFIVLAGIQA